MSVDRLRSLLAHAAWADAGVWEAVLTCPGSGSDLRTFELLHHVHGVQWAYLQVLGGEPVSLPESSSFPDLAAVREWGRRAHDGLGRFVGEVDEEELGRTVEVPWAAQVAERFGKIQHSDVEESLLQVALHSTYHRGQVNARLRELGGEPPLVDWIVWVWAGRPQPAWPEPDAEAPR